MNFGKLSNGYRPAIHYDDLAAAAVARLLGWRLPQTVSGLIVSVIVLAAESFALRPLTHISRKRLKRVLPPWANNNTPAAVGWIFRVPWIRTSLNHLAPRLVKVRLRPLARHPVPKPSRVIDFPTSTRFGVPIPQVLPIHNPFSTAGTHTIPHYASRAGHPSHRFGRQSSKGPVF